MHYGCWFTPGPSAYFSQVVMLVLGNNMSFSCFSTKRIGFLLRFRIGKKFRLSVYASDDNFMWPHMYSLFLKLPLMAVFGSHGHCCEVHISNGDARESFSSQAVSRGRGVGLEDCSFPVNARDGKDGIPSEGRSPRRSPSISNSAWTRINVTTKREDDASQYDMLDS